MDFVPGRDGRGVSVDLDTRLVFLDEGRTAGAGMEAEVGYGLWSGRILGLVRPYLGLTGYPGEASIRRAVGLYLRDTPATHVAGSSSGSTPTTPRRGSGCGRASASDGGSSPTVRTPGRATLLR